MQHIFLTNRNGLDRSRKTRWKLRKKSSNTSWKNCHKPVGLLICQISQVPNKFHKPLGSDLWLNSQTAKCINDQTLRSDIFYPKCPTNVRQIWESTLSKSDYLVGQFGLGRTFWSDVRVDIKRFFFTLLEVNMSNILWSMRICKRTFFPVCKMCGYVNTLVYFYLAPYSRQER